jgi:hypothetical protein
MRRNSRVENEKPYTKPVAIDITSFGIKQSPEKSIIFSKIRIPIQQIAVVKGDRGKGLRSIVFQ